MIYQLTKNTARPVLNQKITIQHSDTTSKNLISDNPSNFENIIQSNYRGKISKQLRIMKQRRHPNLPKKIEPCNDTLNRRR